LPGISLSLPASSLPLIPETMIAGTVSRDEIMKTKATPSLDAIFVRQKRWNDYMDCSTVRNKRSEVNLN